ncbi:MAG TPA: TauD/TfdA family dioxygenase [Pyrinomonadaceae bacterium]|nr:TauD/TfdA family dioxygenase [Pyrinomonadaceae bacterium]
MIEIPGSIKPKIGSIGPLTRKITRVSTANLVITSHLTSNPSLPLVVEPTLNEMDPLAWANSNQDFIESHLLREGGILFRNFGVRTVSEFEQFMEAVAGELLDYSYGSTPRSQVSGRVYTSTEYPPDQDIPLHNEMSYSRAWPRKLFFFCMKAAEQGGETPIADSRRVFNRIDRTIRKRFMKKKVMYVRNYGEGLDLHWRQVFQTTSRSEVEEYCRLNGIEVEWKEKDRLRTRQLCQAVAFHPVTGEMVWFNQAHLFHISSLPEAVRQSFLEEFSEEDLPRNAYHADGSQIDVSMLEQIRHIYQEEAIRFAWKDGDILLLDNMMAAHGRAPFAGPRKVLVGMSQLFTNQDI